MLKLPFYLKMEPSQKISLNLQGDVPEIDAEQFQQIAHKSKYACPISKLLNAEIFN